jgi:3-deoxy-7-phosphoheptulonate synthase
MQIENSNISEIVPLAPPRALKAKLPLPDATRALVLQSREAIRAALHGRDRRRFVVVVGPCSIHDPRAAREYAERLQKVAEATRDRLLVVMRTYFEKPRTVVGWKGLVSDPRLDGSSDIEAGLALARSVLLGIGELGLPCATEFLDPIVPQYVADLISWVAIGARTSESQTHRQMASGLSMPVGFKNGTDGSLVNALNAIVSAQHAHAFLGIDSEGATAVVRTTGNPDGHIVLRGGGGQTNYQAQAVSQAADLVQKEGIVRGVLVDCSHGNSGNDPGRQAAVFEEVVATYAAGENRLLGTMLESNLFPGRQSWVEGQPLQYGVSITDGCLGWDETERLLYEASERIALRTSTSRTRT